MILLIVNGIECSQHFSHCKSTGIFPDAQGQLTPQSSVRSGMAKFPHNKSGAI